MHEFRIILFLYSSLTLLNKNEYYVKLRGQNFLKICKGSISIADLKYFVSLKIPHFFRAVFRTCKLNV